VIAGALAAGVLGHAPSAAAQAAPPPWTLKAALGAPKALTVSGSTRLRYETIEGQPRAGFNSWDQLTNLRTTLFAEYDAGPVRFGAELYDSRAYGADRGTPLSTGEVNTLELAQPTWRTTRRRPSAPARQRRFRRGASC
jgi:hypothetical protein